MPTLRALRALRLARGPAAHRLSWTVAGTLAALSSGCGGAPPAAQAPIAPAPVAAPPAPAPPDLSAVAEPKGLVLSGRVGKLSASLATLRSWTQLPMPESEQLSELLSSEAIGAVVDPDQPVDFAVAATGSGMGLRALSAASAAVKDPDAVRARLAGRYKLVPGDNGVTLVQGLGRSHDGDGDDDGSREGRRCELAPAFGDAPVRLVCATSDAALAALGAWLTRTATRAPTRSDLHVELHTAAVASTVRDGRPLAAAIFAAEIGAFLPGQEGRAMAGPLGGDLADLAADVDAGSLDLTLGPAEAHAVLTLSLTGTASSIGRAAAGHPERGGPAPAAFWQLPADADVALFGRGMDDPQVARARDVVLDAIGAGLGRDGVKAPDIKAVNAALGQLASGAPLVYASGLDVGQLRSAVAADKALTPDSPPAARAAAVHAVAEAALGWRVLELERPAAPVVAALRELASALGRPSILAAAHSRDAEATPARLRSVPLGKAPGLPAGTSHWVLELAVAQRPGAQVKPDPKKPVPLPPRPVLFHLYVAPDGARTWLGMGGDEAIVASRLATSLGSAGDKLGARPELAALKEGSVGAGGFLSTRGILETPLEMRVLAGAAPWGAAELLDDVGPGGKPPSPLVLSLTAQPGGPPATVVARIAVPRATVEEAVAHVLRRGGF